MSWESLPLTRRRCLLVGDGGANTALAVSDLYFVLLEPLQWENLQHGTVNIRSIK